MDQLRPKLIQEADERSREVRDEIERLVTIRRRIVPESQHKMHRIAEIDAQIAQLQIERRDLWAYGARLQIPTYSASQG